VPANIPVTITAADLLMATAAVETALGTYLLQIKGPARGVFQVEPATLGSSLLRMSLTQHRQLQTIRTRNRCLTSSIRI
jgi:hypothetical protein